MDYIFSPFIGSMGENFEEKKCKEIISTVAVILFNKFSGLRIRSLAHRSFPSNQMSDCEQFAQITQDK